MESNLHIYGVENSQFKIVLKRYDHFNNKCNERKK